MSKKRNLAARTDDSSYECTTKHEIFFHKHFGIEKRYKLKRRRVERVDMLEDTMSPDINMN